MAKEADSGPESGENGGSGRPIPTPSATLSPGLASAAQWLKMNHATGCQCRKCIQARARVREAISVAECNCSWCLVCWARARLMDGTL